MSAYCELLESIKESFFTLRENTCSTLPNELRLQSIWFSGHLGRDFITEDGRKVRIIQFGEWNSGKGPDFLHTAVKIEGEKLAGSIELDITPSNWESHGHSESTDFNDVVLHIVFKEHGKEFFTRTKENRLVPRVFIPAHKLEEALMSKPLQTARAHPGACKAPLKEMHEGNIHALMLEAVRHRAHGKIIRRSHVIENHGHDQWLWQSLAETLGYRPNKLAMTLLAQRLSIKHLRKYAAHAEAIIFGTAGFLTAQLHEKAPEDSRQYLRDLWEKWWQVRSDYEPSPDRNIPWNLSGVRPINHPQRRLACLAQVLRKWTDFLKACKSLTKTQDFFDGLTHPFWNHHYTLSSKRSEKKLALMGAERMNDFVINHLLPVRLQEGDSSAWELYLKTPSGALSEKVERASVRLFGDSERRKKYLHKAWQHQALLQIYHDFCLQDTSDCENCLFPEQLAQWKG